MLERIYRVPFREAAKKYCLLGRPEDCLEQMQTFARAGARHFVFSMLSDPAEFIEGYERVIRPGLGGIELPGS
jgi:alkanesulfonate monooxygenase SsuD/methylene tetrahydromethanopterin reductase-like flavin-dependent oxidoreductase (luciferase family)